MSDALAKRWKPTRVIDTRDFQKVTRHRPSAYMIPRHFELLKTARKCGCGAIVYVVHKRKRVCYACAIQAGIVLEEEEGRKPPATTPPVTDEQLAERIEQARRLREQVAPDASILSLLEASMEGSTSKKRRDFMPRKEALETERIG